MLVIRREQLEQLGRIVSCPRGGFVSRRYVLAGDDMGFSLHETFVPAGPPQRWHYKHHVEACYCVYGFGVLRSESSGQEWYISPGVVYAPNQHDAHTFQAITDVTLICVFNPPVIGNEVHREDGSYAAAEVSR